MLRSDTFTTVTLHSGDASGEVSAMIDYGSSWNLISHLLAREHQLPKYGKTPSDLKTVDGSPIQVYGQHLLPVMAKDSRGGESLLRQLFLSMAITGNVPIDPRVTLALCRNTMDRLAPWDAFLPRKSGPFIRVLRSEILKGTRNKCPRIRPPSQRRRESSRTNSLEKEPRKLPGKAQDAEG